jgi:two-component system, chemotaxis family, chemotaxis protein CheY
VRVLLVDDEPGVRLMVAKRLSRCGWRVDKVLDGEEALSASSNVEYDAVVLDQRLPGRSGIEVAAELSPDLPVVLFTAHLDRITQGAADAAGVRVVEKGDLEGLVLALEEAAKDA